MADDIQELPVTNEDVLRMTTDIVASFVSNNTIPADTVADVITKVHGTVYKLAMDGSEGPREKQKPAVPIKQSVTNDYVICLEDGKQLKMLKRYLRTNFGMTPEEYRRKWNLPADYPMVAPSYSKRRSKFAKEIGLGTQTRKKKKPARARATTAKSRAKARK